MALYTRAKLAERAAHVGITEAAAKSRLYRDAVRKADESFDIFLSHSYLDAKEIFALREDLTELGYTVYVDWIDDENLDRDHVTRDTAATLRARMSQCKCLFYATSSAASSSLWMPWELGYFDGIQSQVAICPVLENPTTSDSYAGREYLGLYPYVSDGDDDKDRRRLWINEDENCYVSFDAWLEGKRPLRH